MEENNNKKKKLRIAAILSWVGVFALSFLIIECNLFRFGELWISIAYLTIFVSAIVFSVKLKKLKPKKRVAKKRVDNNIITARKLYNKKFRHLVFRDLFFTLLILIVVSIPVVIYVAAHYSTLLMIIMLSLLIFMCVFVVPFYYLLVKHFCFKYEELTYNDESIVLFSSTTSVFGYVHQHFHVVYKCKEYSNADRIVWTGDDLLLGGIILPVVKNLIDWFKDVKFSNFLRIDIDTEKSGKLQCVYKLSGGEFIVTDKLDMLEGCFEQTRSSSKEKKKNKKNTKNNANIVEDKENDKN